MILNRIDQTASALLTRACDYGEPFIITNAARGWVEYSSKLFMPTVHQVLIDKQIKILSARSAYENKFPGDAKRWKMEAFQEIAKSYDKHTLTNIIALGDSQIEMEAAKELSRNFSLNFIKTIKFEETPSPAELIKQQQLVTEKFQQIFLCVKSKMIRLEKKKN